VLVGLRKAGVPELSFGFDPKSKDRLDGAAIKTLLFGHEVQGREINAGDPYRRVTAQDGATTATVGEWSDTGRSQVEGDMLCFFYPSIRHGGATVRSFSAIPAALSRRRTSTC
jgi:adenylate cyclase